MMFLASSSFTSSRKCHIAFASIFMASATAVPPHPPYGVSSRQQIGRLRVLVSLASSTQVLWRRSSSASTPDIFFPPISVPFLVRVPAVPPSRRVPANGSDAGAGGSLHPPVFLLPSPDTGSPPLRRSRQQTYFHRRQRTTCRLQYADGAHSL